MTSRAKGFDTESNPFRPELAGWARHWITLSHLRVTLVCTSGHPTCKEWIFYPPCLLSQVSVSGGKGRSVWGSTRRGRKHILAKSREGDDLHGETSLKESRSWAWLEVAVGEQIFLFTISWKREQALRQCRAFALWVSVGSGATCPPGLLPAAVCAASVTRVPILLLMAPFSIPNRGSSQGSTCRVPLHHPRQPHPSPGIIWSHIGSLIPQFQLKWCSCEAALLPRLWCVGKVQHRQGRKEQQQHCEPLMPMLWSFPPGCIAHLMHFIYVMKPSGFVVGIFFVRGILPIWAWDVGWGSSVGEVCQGSRLLLYLRECGWVSRCLFLHGGKTIFPCSPN